MASTEARHARREDQAKPLVDSLTGWLDKLRPKVLSASATANAIDYTLKRWTALVRYIDDGRHPIDDQRKSPRDKNPIENEIRPIALGRKNWLFAGSERAAIIMDLIATAKANGHEPHAWLTDVLTRLPTTKDRNTSTLLPHS